MSYDPTTPLDARVAKSIPEAEATEIRHLADKAAAKLSSMEDDPAIETLLAGEHPHLQVDFDEVRGGQEITVSIALGRHLLRVTRPDGPLMPSSVLDRLDAARSTIALLSRCISMCVLRDRHEDDGESLSAQRDEAETDLLDRIGLAVRTLVDDEDLDVIAPRSPWGPAVIESSDGVLEGFDAFAGNRLKPFVWLEIEASPRVTTIRMKSGERFIPFGEMQAMDAMRFILDEGITEERLASIGIAA
jgi:hypothetical protein